MSEQPPRRESAMLRRLAHWGALSGPRRFLKYSPAPIGALFGLALPEVRRRVVRNLRRIHGRRSAMVEQLEAMETIANYAACFAEAIGSQRPDTEPRVLVHGEERLHEALRQGGVVLVTAHVGPWDIAAQLLGRSLGADVIIVMEREANDAARELQDRHREERGMKVLHVGRHPTDALPLIAHLKKGGIAALQLDRVPPSGRVVNVPLFGEPFRVPEGPFVLAGLSGAQVLPVFARRRGFFDYELSISTAISVGRRPSAGELQVAAESAAGAMEAFVRDCPTQWFHFSAE
ncbi:MAG: hypothetical protein EOO73_06230 [Myxococcales bacterium]|nr:MAG: hypothetical protein EOO73_06230 [Myxococcales bacterium]